MTEHSQPATYAVLTGDIVRSRKLGESPVDRIFTILSEAQAEISSWPDTRLALPLTRFRGDGWQLALRSPRAALRVSLFLRAALRRHGREYATRIGVGLGPADLLDTSMPGRSNGAAFELSGKALDTMAASVRWSARSYLPGPSLIPTVFQLCDRVSDGWTARQAEVMLQLLHPHRPTQRAIAETLSITQQSVTAHVASAGGGTLIDAIHGFERFFDNSRRL
ncbi:MAG: hypothetical protein AAFQ51_16185 [Pseudomonadota bacterium]